MNAIHVISLRESEAKSQSSQRKANKQKKKSRSTYEGACKPRKVVHQDFNETSRLPVKWVKPSSMLRFQTRSRFILQTVKKAYYVIITIIEVCVWPLGGLLLRGRKKNKNKIRKREIIIESEKVFQWVKSNRNWLIKTTWKFRNLNLQKKSPQFQNQNWLLMHA